MLSNTQYSSSSAEDVKSPDYLRNGNTLHSLLSPVFLCYIHLLNLHRLLGKTLELVLGKSRSVSDNILHKLVRR